MGKVLVTGGSGFLGVKLIERLYELGDSDIRVVARNEGKLVEIKQKFPHVAIVGPGIAFLCIFDVVVWLVIGFCVYNDLQ